MFRNQRRRHILDNRVQGETAYRFRPRVLVAAQQVPGFAEGFVLIARIGWRHADGDPLRGHFRRDDVPNIFRDHVDGKVIEVRLQVTPRPDMPHIRHEYAFLVMGLSRAIAAHGGFHLNACEVTAAFDGNVVRGAIAPWLGKFEAQFGGFGHESQFCPLAALFGISDAKTC